MINSISRVVLLVLLLVILFAGNSFGTNFFTSPVPSENSSIGFSFLKPSISGSNNFSFFSGTSYIKARIKASSTMSLNFCIPTSIVNYNSAYSSRDNETSLGNIYIELQTYRNSDDLNKSWLSFELFLPTSDVENSIFSISLYSDYHHYQMYYPEVFSFGAKYSTYQRFGNNNSAYRQLEVGGRLTTTSDTNEDMDFIINYAFALGVDNTEIDFGLELLGQYMLTGEDIDFTDRTTNQIVFGLSYIKDKFQPKLYYLIPLDDGYNDMIGSVLGIGFDVVF